jgi:hypothetical protein
MEIRDRDIAAQDQLLSQLKKDWDKLHDLDRAARVAQIKRTGLSNRDIARKLQRGETLIRRLLVILRASAADRAAARSGKISTNELFRRTKAARKQHANDEQQRQAAEAAKFICDWLKALNMAKPSTEQIATEARRIMIDAYFAGTLPKVVLPNHPLPPRAVIIECCKPKEPLTDEIDPSGWFSTWLARWLPFVFPHPDVRDKAIDIVIDKHCSG